MRMVELLEAQAANRERLGRVTAPFIGTDRLADMQIAVCAEFAGLNLDVQNICGSIHVEPQDVDSAAKFMGIVEYKTDGDMVIGEDFVLHRVNGRWQVDPK